MSSDNKHIVNAKSVAYFLLLLSVAGLMLYQIFSKSFEVTAPQVHHCADLMQGCRMQLDGNTLEVKFTEKPNALHPFEVVVKINGMRQVSAGFAMVGMDMGKNRYNLYSAGENKWAAKVVLPVCVTGRRDWVMTLDLDVTKIQIPFSA